MLGKLKKAGEMLKAQKKANDLKKKLGNIKVEVEEGNVKLTVKGSIAMYEVESIEVNGEELKSAGKALKKANKQISKELQKKVKSGEISMSELQGM